MSELSPSSPPPGKRSRSIYLLPNLFTTSALLAGFYSIVASVNSDYTTSAIAIIVAMALDGFDGRVARMTNTTTAFGAEYDSMADMVSFGVAPALLMYQWSLSSLPPTTYGQLSWVVAFVFTACCGLRLARFTVQVGTADKRFFQGLACPSAAAILASMVWVCTEFDMPGPSLVWLVIPVTLVTAVLMVSSFAYYSFKDLGTSKRIPFAMLLGILLLFVTTAVDPPKMILIASVLYGLSGPSWALFSMLRKRSRQTS
ncbi:MAG: CDP-diacylglycerol--serine O-phosphatidyltransferase [Gammaproteobacteria bacterium]|nr:CDP-diacylglycerol--serine O-phosphatidyltransferase [Gammaproteobacteria bacterium]